MNSFVPILASLFGDIMKVETSGASEKTAKQDKLSVKGVCVCVA